LVSAIFVEVAQKGRSAMTTKNPAGTAIVFACDEAYFFLARGLVLSLLEAGLTDGVGRLILIDIGCGPESLDWMKEHGVEVVEIPQGLIPASVEAVIRPVHRALVVRPHLPALLPQFEHFVWLDCDVWVQDLDFMRIMSHGAHAAPDSVMLAPAISHYNIFFYQNIDTILRMQRCWYSAGYEPKFAEEMAVQPQLSAGVFAMRRGSPIWRLWARQIEHVFPIVAQRDPKLLHMAEQSALNVVVYRFGNYIRLDPIFNFYCNGGGALRLQSGKVVASAMLPLREIGIVHLGGWSAVRRFYIERKLLYRSGEYLTDAERERIAA
jgi:hypothetical protein